MHRIRIAAQLLLGVTLTYAGITHLTTSRIEFQAQVPTWLPLSPDFVVIASGEKAYIVLSLVSKSALGWIIVLGTMGV
jgi:uncharacterized membrane protein